MHYYQFNVGSYRRDTIHLSPLEHGIYRMLIDTYYMDESPLTSDINKLMRTHCIRTADEKQALENVLNDFFFIDDDGMYHNEGCDEGLEKFYKKSESARKSAEARWKKKVKSKASSERNANAMQSVCEIDANSMLPNTHNPIPNNKDNAQSDDFAFDKFWDMYGKKKDLKKCKTKWANIPKKDKSKIFETLPKYIASTPDIKYRKLPYTWLNGECWNDEIEQSTDFRNPTQTQDYTQGW